MLVWSVCVAWPCNSRTEGRTKSTLSIRILTGTRKVTCVSVTMWSLTRHYKV